MSIDRMISLHPQVKGDVNHDLATAARHAMYCALMCTSCADACLAEEMDMSQCIRVCLDCADVCTAASFLMVRQTGRDVAMLRAQMECCIRACEICADECAKCEHEHCKLCETMCRECADDCRKALESVN